MSKDASWYVDINKIRTDYPVIENLKQFLADSPPILPKYHPDYIKYWSKETKKCIEGVWGSEFGKYRYMPGNLYFFGSFTVLEDSKDVNGVRVTKRYKPKIVDYIWEFSYQSWAAYGFSGFELDEEYTCNIKAKDYWDGRIDKQYLPEQCIKPDGEVKEFEEAYDYLHRLHKKKLGKSLFQNPARDSVTLGTRGGGKSFWVALGELEYNFVFGGHRRYDNDFIRGLGSSSRQVVGSADTTKSSDLLDKFKKSQDAKTENKNGDYIKWFGIYTETYLDAKGNTKERITPCPFYKKSMGNLDCPNKDNSYKALYKINVNGEYKPKGSGNELVHVNYSSKKADGHTAGVGGRYLFSNVEEVGLVQNYTGILGAMDSAMKRQTKEGVQHAQGTSGFIEYVQEAKKVFLCPDDYGMIGYRNAFSSSGTNNKICYFIPNYITQFDCKDENGNTQYDKVLEKINRKREEKAKSGDPKVLRDHLMNEPCYVEEMWLTDKGYYLPYEEASLRERELLQFGLYKSLMNPVELYWDDTKPNKVNYKILHDANPYTDFPHDFSKRRDPSGCVVIYEFPEEAAPDDLYIITLDPYIAEELDKGGSVGAAHVWKKSKYISSGITGNTLVATYIGKPEKGLDYYHEQLEKLIAFYGNPTRGIWFEKNRGEAIREYFIRRGKADLLCITPQFKQGTHIYQKNVLSYGFLVGNQVSKLQLLKGLNDWCLEETEFNKHGIVENKINIARIPCIYTIRQMMQYKLDGNFDAVSSCLGMPLAFGEEKAMLEQHLRRKEKDSNSFNYLLQNKRIFHASGNKVKSFR